MKIFYTLLPSYCLFVNGFPIWGWCIVKLSWQQSLVANISLSYSLNSLVPGRCSYNLESLQWRHNGRDIVSNHQPHDCLLNGLFRRRSKKTSKLRVTGLCAGNSPHKWPVTRKMFPFDDVIMQHFYQVISRTHILRISSKMWMPRNLTDD